MDRPAQHNKRRILIPLLKGKVAAGFPSPADEHIERVLDLNELVIAHPAATYFVRARGSSMIHDGIHDGAVMVVDRALNVKPGDIIVARLGSRFTVKRYMKKGGNLFLVPSNPLFRPLKITTETDFAVWGVVRAVVLIFIKKEL